MQHERVARAKLTNEIRERMRELIARLHQLNDAVGNRIDLKAGDIEILDLVARHGPMSPSEVTVSTGIHPATLTGVIDRLEGAGWLSRVPDPDDRRRVRLEARRERGAEMARLYAPMNRSLSEICSGLSPEQLTVIRDFLREAASAGSDAAAELRAAD
ncbi:MAG: MarR family winged helix-turn-helix transcriptional regulator [Acidimicrobiia bacterium]